MVDRICAAPGYGKTFNAQRRTARFCSDGCRLEGHRADGSAISLSGRGRSANPDEHVTIGVSNPPETLDKLLAKRGELPSLPPPDLRWERQDEVTWRLMAGRRVVAHVIDKGLTEQASWCAHRGSLTIGPAWMEAAGLSVDRAGLNEARLVAKAMATGDVRPLVLAAHQLDDCTEDMSLALRGMRELLKEPDEDDGPTELPDFETEESMVARLNFHWCLVQGDGFWILQHRLGDGADWEWAGRFNRKRSLVHAIGYLVGEVDMEAKAILDALPEKP